MNPYSTKGLDDMALSSVVSRLLEQALQSLDPRSIKVEIILQLPT